MNFWKVKTFKTIEAMNQWLEKNHGFIEFDEVYINNLYGVEYRKLKTIY